MFEASNVLMKYAQGLIVFCFVFKLDTFDTLSFIKNLCLMLPEPFLFYLKFALPLVYLISLSLTHFVL
jgi:hypothetical protein